jgi:hypothetical protein
MMFVIYNNIEHLYYSKVFSWCNLKLADRFTNEEIINHPVSDDCQWLTEETAEAFESIPWED